MKMTIGRALCVAVVVFHFSINLAAELTMPSCTNGWTMVQDDTDTVITCSHPSLYQTVLWSVENSTSSHTLFEWSCAIIQKNCTFSSNYHINLTLDDDLQNVPTLTQCKIEVNTGSRTVTGSCNIDKFFSSNNLASCVVTQRMGKTAIYGKHVGGQISLQDYTDSEDNKSYKQGNCSFVIDLPTAVGNYTYSMVVAPTQEQETVGKIEIETTCTIYEGNCFWECLKRPGVPPRYICNRSDRLFELPFGLSTSDPSENRHPATGNIVAEVLVVLLSLLLLSLSYTS